MGGPAPTERLHRVLAFASDEADGLGHAYVNCQHLLYALSRENKGMAGLVLEECGITAERLHALLSSFSTSYDRTDGSLDLADDARAAMDRAVSAALDSGHRWLDTEHLLIGILRERTSADELLADLRVRPQDVLSRLASLQEVAPPASIREEATHAYRFTLESAWLLSLASDHARQDGAAAITCIHLLAALLVLEGPVRELLVSQHGLSVEEVKLHLRRISSSTGNQTISEKRLSLDEDVQVILGFSIGEAWNRDHLAVSPIHIAMGLARATDSPALELIADWGVSQAELIDAVTSIMPASSIGYERRPHQ
jgi:ATP-dependent Clp protease ATP-binding subunit ClpA